MREGFKRLGELFPAPVETAGAETRSDGPNTAGALPGRWPPPNLTGWRWAPQVGVAALLWEACSGFLAAASAPDTNQCLLRHHLVAGIRLAPVGALRDHVAGPLNFRPRDHLGNRVGFYARLVRRHRRARGSPRVIHRQLRVCETRSTWRWLGLGVARAGAPEMKRSPQNFSS